MTLMELIEAYAHNYYGEPLEDEYNQARTAVVEAVEKLERDAKLGDIAMKFVDRAGDVADCDPAERICAEFYDAMSKAVNEYCKAMEATNGQGN